MVFGTSFLRKAEHIFLETDEARASEIAKLHGGSFPRGWHAEEVASLLRTKGTFAIVAQPVGRPNVAPSGFVVVRAAGDEAEIITIGVAPAMRRKQLGWQLMEAVIRKLRGEGITALFLEVAEHNEAALKLYRRLGFEKIGERKGYYETGGGAQQKPANALVMRLEIS